MNTKTNPHTMTRAEALALDPTTAQAPDVTAACGALLKGGDLRRSWISGDVFAEAENGKKLHGWDGQRELLAWLQDNTKWGRAAFGENDRFHVIGMLGGEEPEEHEVSRAEFLALRDRWRRSYGPDHDLDYETEPVMYDSAGRVVIQAHTADGVWDIEEMQDGSRVFMH